MFTSRLFIAIAGAVVAAASFAADLQAQGCVASRMNAPSGPVDPQGNGYYLADGKWQAIIGYRHFESHRHFVGSVEQSADNVANGTAERDRSTTEVVNHVSIPELVASYGLSDRLSLNVDVPIFIATRLIPGNVFKVFRNIDGAPDQNTSAHGIGDVNLMGRYWIADPSHHSVQNLAVGFGFKLPTGRKDVTDSVTTISATGAAPVTKVSPVDQSIQPGDGGFGFVTEVQGFKSFGKATAFVTGSYLFNPRETNGVLTGRKPSEAVMSVADQYGARLGVGYAASHKLGISLAARLEGVPVHDALGGSEGFRRPGYSIGIEPGLSYSFRNSSVSLSVPYLIRRVRPQNVPDIEDSAAQGKHVQGDAAFADYIIVGSFTKRF